MLLFRSHWHNARERAPEREARLLAFANGGNPNQTGADPQPDRPDNPLENAENIASAGHAVTGQPVSADAVDAERNETRERVAGAVTKEEGPDTPGTERSESSAEKTININDVLRKATDLLGKMEAMHTSVQSLSGTLRKNMPPENLKRWNELESFLAIERLTVQSWINFLEPLARWNSHTMSPVELRDFLKREHFKSKEIGHMADDGETARETAYRTLDNFMQQTKGNAIESPFSGELPDITTRNNWDTYNIGTKVEVNRAILEKGGLNELISHIDDSINTYEAAIKNSAAVEMVEIVRSKLQGEQIQPDAVDRHRLNVRKTLESVGVGLYSINEMMEGLTEVKEAITQSWSRKRQLQAAKFAKSVGVVVDPFVEGVGRTLDSNLTAKNEEAKENYKKYLNSRNLSFRQLFDPGQEMDKNIDDPNRSLAVLEFAASKGWLYRFEEFKAAPWNAKLIMNKYYLHEFLPGQDENAVNGYYINLLSQNEDGAKKEAAAAKSREETTENPHDFIAAINRELDGLNLWGAKGIMERAFERGLIGEISPLMAVTFMRHLRKTSKPNIRELVSASMLDQIGTIAAYTPAFTLGLLKFERPQILEYSRDYSKNFAEAGTLGRVIAQIETEIMAKDPNTLPQQLDVLVAKVLAAQTVRLRNGSYVSIFSPSYDYYNNGSGKQEDMDISKIDLDFYRERSEVLMSDSIVVGNILTVNGSGEFKDGSRAGHFLSRVLEATAELRANAKKARTPEEKRELEQGADDFTEKMKEKMTAWIEGAFKNPRTQPLAAASLGDQKTPALLNIIVSGFITLDTVEAGLGEQGKPLATSLLRQCAALDETSKNKPIRDQARKILADYKIPLTAKPKEERAAESSQSTAA